MFGLVEQEKRKKIYKLPNDHLFEMEMQSTAMHTYAGVYAVEVKRKNEHNKHSPLLLFEKLKYQIQICGIRM